MLQLALYFWPIEPRPVISPSKQISLQPLSYQNTDRLRKLVFIENAHCREEGKSQGNYLGQANKYLYLEYNQWSSFSKVYFLESLSIGSGKSSLFRILCGIWSPLSGTSCFGIIILNIFWTK